MKMKSKLLFALVMLISGFTVLAGNSEPEMADAFRSNGKIYVVLGCVLLVLAGIIVFLLMLERRISGLENKLKK